MASGAANINSDGCSRATDPDTALSRSPDLVDAVDPGDKVGHHIDMAPMAHINMSLDSGLIPIISIGAMDINRNSGCGKATDPNMALGSSPGLNNTMASGDSVFYSMDMVSSTALEHQRGHCILDPRHLCTIWWQQDPLTSTRPPAVVGPQAWFSAAARVQMSPQPRGEHSSLGLS